MSVGARVLVFVVKWLLVPAALGFIGFKFVGPQIGRPPVATTSALDQVKRPGTEKPVANVASKKRYGEPEVEITVSKAKRTSSSRLAEPPRKSRKTETIDTGTAESQKITASGRRVTEPEKPAEKPTEPETGGDEGGSGGAAGTDPPPTTTGGDGASIQNRHIG